MNKYQISEYTYWLFAFRHCLDNRQCTEKLLDQVSLAENLLETRHGGTAETFVTYQSYTVDNPTDNDQQARWFYHRIYSVVLLRHIPDFQVDIEQQQYGTGS